MNFRVYFNFILLGLCLTTLGITLVTYIIFRIRQSLDKKEPKGLVKLGGHFFKRYSPKVEKMNEALSSESIVSAGFGSSFKLKRRVVFASLFFGIFTLLATEHFFVLRGELSNRAVSVERIRALIAKGLMKSYEYREASTFSSSEVYPHGLREAVASKAAALRDQKIALFTSRANRTANPDHVEGFNAWREFLKAHQIPFRVVEGIKSGRTDEIWLLSNFKIVTDSEFKRLESHLDQSGRAFVTGLLAAENRTLKTASLQWFENKFGLSAYPRSERMTLPSQLRVGQAPLWDVPAGLLIDFKQSEKNYVFTSKNNEDTAAYETYASGRRAATNNQYHATLKVGPSTYDRWVWTNLLPSSKAQDDLYRSDIWLSALSWSARIPTLRIASWPRGESGATVISVDAEDEFLNLEKLSQVSATHDIPLTVFAVSDLLKNSKIELDQLEAVREWASHTNDHQLMSSFSDKQNFRRLQQSRLDIEQITGSEVRGFRPPQEVLDLEVIQSVIQNRFSYLFGAETKYQYMPYRLAGRELLYFPRTVSDDILLAQQTSIDSPDQLAQVMLDEHSRTHFFGGGYFFSMHTQSFGADQFYLDTLASFYKKVKKRNTWLATFGELTDWVDQREHIELETGRDPIKGLYVKVTNRHENEIRDAVLEFSLNSQQSIRDIASKKIDKKIRKIKLKNLSPNKGQVIFLRR